MNATSSQSSITNAENMNPMSGAHLEGVMGAVSRELDYGMDLANFILGKHSLDLFHIGCEAKVTCMAVLPNGTGQEVSAQ